MPPLRPNPFYINVKPEGRKMQRIGPMSEADFWIEDVPDENLAPLITSADPTWDEIGGLLRERRMDLGLSLNQVAEMAGISKGYLQDLESARGGTRKAAPRVIYDHIAKMLDARFEGPMPERKTSYKQYGDRDEVLDNPSGEPSDADIEHYLYFHGVPPDEYIDMHTWVPGGMVLIGTGQDVGYGILNKRSKKDGWYVHDFGPQVKVYRRAKSGERATKTWSSFPSQLTSLGYNIGFTYIDPDGNMKEVKGSQRKYLGVTPNRRTLVVVGPRGVEYLMEGGNMRVDDWIRD